MQLPPQVITHTPWLRRLGILLIAIVAIGILWPFYSVPTGSRGDMRNFAFGADYMKAINDKVTQEQLRLAAENKLKTVEAEQKQKVAVAEAEAKATIATAQATAQSLRIQNEALARNKDVLDLRRIEVEKIKAERWDGKLPTNIYAGAPIPFLNLSK
jgi:prohibitin 2